MPYEILIQAVITSLSIRRTGKIILSFRHHCRHSTIRSGLPPWFLYPLSERETIGLISGYDCAFSRPCQPPGPMFQTLAPGREEGRSKEERPQKLPLSINLAVSLISFSREMKINAPKHLLVRPKRRLKAASLQIIAVLKQVTLMPPDWQPGLHLSWMKRIEPFCRSFLLVVCEGISLFIHSWLTDWLLLVELCCGFCSVGAGVMQSNWRACSTLAGRGNLLVLFSVFPPKTTWEMVSEIFSSVLSKLCFLPAGDGSGWASDKWHAAGMRVLVSLRVFAGRRAPQLRP